MVKRYPSAWFDQGSIYSPDDRRSYVAEAGCHSVIILVFNVKRFTSPISRRESCGAVAGAGTRDQALWHQARSPAPAASDQLPRRHGAGGGLDLSS